MKNLKLFFLGLIAALIVTGCDHNDDDNGFFICKDGKGATVTRNISLPIITGIDLEIKAQVFISYGETQEVTLKGQKNVLDELQFRVKNGIARIDFDDCIDDYSTLKIFITTPKMRHLEIDGSGKIKSENTLVVQDIYLEVDGSGDIDVDLGAADNVDVDISGSGKITLQGTADDLDVDITGSGDLRAFDLLAKIADISITGSGDAEVNVEDDLEVSISGSGDVMYKGNPTVTVNISGSGELIDAN